MEIRIVAYGIAKDILQGKNKSLALTTGNDIGALKKLLLAEYPAFGQLKKLSFAVDGEYRKDDFPLSEHHEVVIIPPVSGG